MEIRDAIRRMMSQSRYNGSQLSIALGKNRTFLSTSFSKGTVHRVDTLARMCEIMGYRIVLESDNDRIVIDPPRGTATVDGANEKG